MDAKGTQVHAKVKQSKQRIGPYPWLCNAVPTSVPAPGQAQAIIHPRKDVFVLKSFQNHLPASSLDPGNYLGPEYLSRRVERVQIRWGYVVLLVAKIGPNGDRRCKMELELVTPKGPGKPVPSRLETREVQCEPEPDPCCCNKPKKKRK